MDSYEEQLRGENRGLLDQAEELKMELDEWRRRALIAEAEWDRANEVIRDIRLLVSDGMG